MTLAASPRPEARGPRLEARANPEALIPTQDARGPKPEGQRDQEPMPTPTSLGKLFNPMVTAMRASLEPFESEAVIRTCLIQAAAK